jgi:2-C-methyl-D-erythritol 4-phosphate cytidylyltransferase
VSAADPTGGAPDGGAPAQGAFDLPAPRRAAPPPPHAVRRARADGDVDRQAGRDVGVVIVAGGQGTRAAGDGGELKQFRWIAGKPMLLHSVQTFMARADVHTVVVVLPRSHAADPPPWLFQCDVDRLLVSTGGRERAESVANGLEDVPEECAVVLVHDAARPFVPDAVIERVVAAARRGVGAVPALPVVDTLKEVGDGGLVARTVERARLWRAQTPQGFPRPMLDDAHARARRDGLAATDDAALCERLGYPVEVVLGDERALKVTETGDFARAEALSILPG